MAQKPKDDISDLENEMNIYVILGWISVIIAVVFIVYFVIWLINRKKKKSAFSYKY